MNNAATPHEEVNLVLDDLLRRAREILASEFVGMYLYGSLAAGDFDGQRSDIDFVVVTRDLLAEDVVADLARMHAELAAGDSKWAKKLEGQYIPIDLLWRWDAQGPPLPTVNEQKFYLAGQGSDWVIQRHVLREQETIVAGPSMRDHIAPVQPSEMKAAVRQVLNDWWSPMVTDPSWLAARPDYQAFAVQTMCRILYTLRFATAVTKTDAARWMSERLGGEQGAFVEEALAWTAERPPLGMDRTTEFLRFAIAASEDSDR